MTQDHEALPYRLGLAVLAALRDASEANTDLIITCDTEAVCILQANGEAEHVEVYMTEQELITHGLDAVA